MKRILFVLALILLSSTSFAAMRFHPIPYSRPTPTPPAANITAYVWPDGNDDMYWGAVFEVPDGMLDIGPDPGLPYDYWVTSLVYKNNTSSVESSLPSEYITYLGKSVNNKDLWYYAGMVYGVPPSTSAPLDFFGAPTDEYGASNVSVISMVVEHIGETTTFTTPFQVKWYKWDTLGTLPIWP